MKSGIIIIYGLQACVVVTVSEYPSPAWILALALFWHALGCSWVESTHGVSPLAYGEAMVDIAKGGHFSSMTLA